MIDFTLNIQPRSVLGRTHIRFVYDVMMSWKLGLLKSKKPKVIHTATTRKEAHTYVKGFLDRCLIQASLSE